jgi:succinoglycan biosynthesis protein ExoA
VVNEVLPSVTILIAARPDQADIKAVTAAKLLDYPREKLEILVARGKQPSVQRNAGVRAARGEIIYFLDDDSVPPLDNLRRVATAFADPAVKMVGGPNLCPTDAPLLEQVFALVHASLLAFGPSRARYTRVGKSRASGEKELILCNLAARRDAMLELGGFNELLYPNEENALMDDLQKRGKLLYDPDLFVYRRPRRSLKSFVKMLLNYGRGRAEQFRLNPTVGSAPNFAPPLFCVYLVALPLLWLPLKWLSLLPLAVYGAALLAQAAVLVPQGGFFKSLAAMPLMFLTHVIYGAGFARGLFTRLKASPDRPKTEVVLETVAL